MTETLGKGGKRLPCQTCQQPGYYLCDYPVKRQGVNGSCGRVMCKQHATRVGGGVAHYCPPHERASRPQVPPAPAKQQGPAVECVHNWYDPSCRCGVPAPPPEAAE